MKKEDNNNRRSPMLKPLHNSLLLASIALYLERSGFSKTLNKFRSEAKVEKHDLGNSSFDLEEIFNKFLDICDNVGEKSEKQNVEENIKKRKKKKSSNHDDHEIDGQLTAGGKNTDCKIAEEITTEDADSIDAKSKEKKRTKKNSDSIGQEQVKEKKKKKSNLDSESVIDNIRDHSSESLPGLTKDKHKDVVFPEGKNVVNSEKENISTGTKKKKKKPSSDPVLDNVEENVSEKLERQSKEDMTDNKKNYKKRKILASEEDATQPTDKNAVKELKRRKTEGSEEPKENVQPTESKSPIPSDGQANGNLEKYGENLDLQKITKEQLNGIVELQTAKRFQRVKVDEVAFSDERLKDNSYWAKDGAEGGYGAKAEEILGQVRGRNFRHEKTKKKRGAYRGGQIDLQSHSIKFNYSDDD